MHDDDMDYMTGDISDEREQMMDAYHAGVGDGLHACALTDPDSGPCADLKCRTCYFHCPACRAWIWHRFDERSGKTWAEDGSGIHACEGSDDVNWEAHFVY